MSIYRTPIKDSKHEKQHIKKVNVHCKSDIGTNNKYTMLFMMSSNVFLC